MALPDLKEIFDTSIKAIILSNEIIYFSMEKITPWSTSLWSLGRFLISVSVWPRYSQRFWEYILTLLSCKEIAKPDLFGENNFMMEFQKSMILVYLR